ncbi:hypothetical protein A7U60_g1114 [Sanghuangporus baumii]|uniref:DUF6534 domain-containing protein n=1 Tax=Sanghuangporus baumii TaxID=108892 RepID=A0A9Q5I4M4_SANBA|nr:hypothetical protein A7U60_g1114 [Sanghuangporus baumii]
MIIADIASPHTCLPAPSQGIPPLQVFLLLGYCSREAGIMASTISMPALNVDITFGCLFISHFVSVNFVTIPSRTCFDQVSSLWGVGCLQFYLYCEKYWNTEKRWFKVYMSTLWIMDTVHQALIANATYVCFVKGIADPTSLVRFQKTGPAISGLTAFIDAMVQAILIRRAWYLSSKNRILTGALSIAVLAQFAVTMAYFTRIVSVSELPMIDNAIPMQLAASVAAQFTDTYLAVVLVWLLRKARSGFRRSDSIVQRLVTYTIGSSLVTAICASFALISAAVAPHSFIYLLGDFLLAKLYFNCLHALLGPYCRFQNCLEKQIT